MQENKVNNEFKFSDTDIEEKIELEPFETIYHYDLRFSFGLMTKGKLLLVYENEKGRRVPLKTLTKKETILGGYAYLLEGKAIDNLYYIAIEKTEILKVSPERSRELLLDRDFLFRCLKNAKMDSLSLIEELVYRLDKNIEKFLAYVLLNYSENGKMRIKNFSLFSEFIKCSRSNFYLALGKLVDRGIVERDGRVITIVDWEELKKFAEI
ncbi:Crp/Fnr family transcriptional regulator [Ilyobacter polytropus]|uniref:Transcriptional regulator, Crp/Fnr family n=1 Tax=Ilyobacter polytropus (strain ATCC 51220 / DSM 2926 / LMG 16218 / CuHBu1) TaxID=572544 RepID=E3H6R1_ILYPC|nr:Crp/Fnr family transcriptional regulator [Ilyobacter polytropus]ADO82430.1 putative transcriptional regulator, Crp/Fnr family [Ilyobacter polytropus DSM 2926]